MATAARQIIFATTPLTFNRDGALAYTGLSPKLFASLEKGRQLTGRKWGRNGEIIYQRAELDAVTARLFGNAGGPANDLDDEFDLGED